MRHLIAQMMNVTVEFKIFGNRIWINSNNPMVKEQFVKFIETKGKEMAKGNESALPSVERDSRTDWLKVTMAYPETKETENMLAEKFKADLIKSGMGVTEK